MTKQRTASRYAAGRSRVAIQAAFELRVDLFDVGYREVHVVAVWQSPLEVGALGEDLVLGATVLTNQSTQIAEPLAAAERPEALLAEEERDSGRLVRRRGEGGHCRWLERADPRRGRAQRVEDRHHAANVADV